MQEFIPQVVGEILSEVRNLNPTWRKMFLSWLGNHISQVRCFEEARYQDCLTVKLTAWFASMNLIGILWEYRLIMGEIEWWKAQEQTALERVEAA